VSIVAAVWLEKRSEIVSLPLAERQGVEFAGAGPVALEHWRLGA